MPEQVAAAKAWIGRHRAGIVIGVLAAVLGFGIAVQVRSNSSGDSLANAREDDLDSILDDQNARADHLRQQIAELQRHAAAVAGQRQPGHRCRAASRAGAQALDVLLGTLPATGPGVSITITDPAHKLHAEDLLDVVEELRGAGAEAIQFGTVRVSTANGFTDDGSAVRVDGQAQQAPYVVLAIGDPKTLDTAMNIPGGVAATVRAAGGDAQVTERDKVQISAVRALPTPKYAAPSPK